ncbi:MAG: cupin domain-containing protein [Rubrivivax sp.]|jgi:hypothetical protein
MDPQGFEQYSQDARQRGYDEVLVREWQPGQATGEHTHPFDARVMVVRGEVTLQVGGQARRYGPGELFELVRDTPHTEQYGPQGATFWTARRH